MRIDAMSCAKIRVSVEPVFDTKDEEIFFNDLVGFRKCIDPILVDASSFDILGRGARFAFIHNLASAIFYRLAWRGENC